MEFTVYIKIKHMTKAQKAEKQKYGSYTWNSVISLRVDHDKLNTINYKTTPKITKQGVMANKPKKINNSKIWKQKNRKMETKNRWDKKKSNGHVTFLNLPILIITWNVNCLENKLEDRAYHTKQKARPKYVLLTRNAFSPQRHKLDKSKKMETDISEQYSPKEECYHSKKIEGYLIMKRAYVHHET